MKTNAPFYSELDSPVGVLLLRGDGAVLTGLFMDEQRHRPALPEGCERNDRAFRAVREQLNAYFAGKLQKFEIALAGEGSPMQDPVR
jgi:methylated-DNA-[protein]-cysteine S-methyltransferase